MRPNAYIIAGPNGVGKTTFAREFLPNYADCKNFVNADLIAQGIAIALEEHGRFRIMRPDTYKALVAQYGKHD